MGNKHREPSVCRLVRCLDDPYAPRSNYLLHYCLCGSSPVDIDGIRELVFGSSMETTLLRRSRA